MGDWLFRPPFLLLAAALAAATANEDDSVLVGAPPFIAPGGTVGVVIAAGVAGESASVMSRAASPRLSYY